ncbi:MAG: thioesterase domain-containing protein, partial [Pseudomonadota bacterium]
PAMADHYAGEMRKLQPTGPYYVGGYSFGGWIALEVARRLQDAGEEVALLAILDTTFVGRRAALPLRARLQRHMGVGQKLTRPGPFDGSVPRMIAHQLRLEAMAKCRRLGLLDKALDSRFRRYPVEAHSIGLRLYSPKPYPGDAVLFHSECDAPQLARDYGGWQGLISGTLETQPIPGSHSDMMYDPAVQNLGRALSERIARAVRR